MVGLTVPDAWEGVQKADPAEGPFWRRRGRWGNEGPGSRRPGKGLSALLAVPVVADSGNPVTACGLFIGAANRLWQVNVKKWGIF